LQDDLSALVKSTVQAAVDAAGLSENDSDEHAKGHHRLDDNAEGAAEPAISARSSRGGAQSSTSRERAATGTPERERRSLSHRTGGAGAPEKAGPSAADRLDVPGQPQTSLRLHKAQIKV
jgi:hypothetical protein